MMRLGGWSSPVIGSCAVPWGRPWLVYQGAGLPLLQSGPRGRPRLRRRAGNRPGAGAGSAALDGHGDGGCQVRILLLASAYNSLTQRVHGELAGHGHEVAVELALGDEVMREAARRHGPDLVIAPMLTAAIPADIWSAWPCFIVHPGPPRSEERRVGKECRCRW